MDGVAAATGLAVTGRACLGGAGAGALLDVGPGTANGMAINVLTMGAGAVVASPGADKGAGMASS